MRQASQDTKERIMDTVVKLLMEGRDVGSIPVRQLAELARVNSALINYHYQSKENLLREAVSVCMESMAHQVFEEDQEDLAPADRLKKMLLSIASFASHNRHLAKILIASELEEGNLNTSQAMLPLLMAHFNGRKTDRELKVIAMQLVVPMQVLLLHESAYARFLLMDLQDEKQRKALLEKMVDNLLQINTDLQE